MRLNSSSKKVKSGKPRPPATPKHRSPRSVEQREQIAVPPLHDWRTTDEDEINRRRQRAREESFVIRNTDARFPIFSNFSVASANGLTYSVEIREVGARQFACTCQDFRKNELGTCKHVEAVLLHLEARFKRLFVQAARHGSPRVDLAPDEAENTLRIERGLTQLPAPVRCWFDKAGRLNGVPVEEARTPLLDAALALSCALAVENRLPEPAALELALQPPLAAAWGQPVTVLHDLVEAPAGDGQALMGEMEKLLRKGPQGEGALT